MGKRDYGFGFLPTYAMTLAVCTVLVDVNLFDAC